jgi:hypothetical protein
MNKLDAQQFLKSCMVIAANKRLKEERERQTSIRSSRDFLEDLASEEFKKIIATFYGPNVWIVASQAYFAKRSYLEYYKNNWERIVNYATN